MCSVVLWYLKPTNSIVSRVGRKLSRDLLGASTIPAATCLESEVLSHIKLVVLEQYSRFACDTVLMMFHSINLAHGAGWKHKVLVWWICNASRVWGKLLTCLRDALFRSGIWYNSCLELLAASISWELSYQS